MCSTTGKTDPIGAAIKLVCGLYSGTTCKTDAEVAARLRRQEHPEPVDPATLANLIDALLGDYGPEAIPGPPLRDYGPDAIPDPLPRAIATHWDEGTVREVGAALTSRIDHLTRFADEFGIDPESHVGQQIATERRRLACAKLDLDAVPLARTRLAAERIGARVCVTCEQLIAPDLRSGLWRASRDVFAPGDSCESHDHRHTPEGTDA